jgi:hypothetical protein
VRLFAVRDALLGVALLRALDDPARTATALAVCAAADAADAVVMGLAFVRTRRPGAALAALTATGGVLTGLALASRLRGAPALR